MSLADHIEKAEDFDQGNWHRCICGQAVILFGDTYGHPRDYSEARIEWGANMLGITYEQARELFCNFPPPVDRFEAARAVRHLALTGEVIWHPKRTPTLAEALCEVLGG